MRRSTPAVGVMVDVLLAWLCHNVQGRQLITRHELVRVVKKTWDDVARAGGLS